jgi:nitroimidazol reductase NimA-like FMN-containing flavoprotein (pyridoxamine 5'-phosphate oxidase superfamily)
MIRFLAIEEIERVLRAEAVGRLACAAYGRPYVVPVSYVYRDGAIYGHAAEGLKVHMMRANPSVCFEVDHIEDLANWHSVVGWGRYEELHGQDAQDGLQALREGLQGRLPGLTPHQTLATNAPAPEPIVFRIRLTEVSGREERLYWELLAEANAAHPAEPPVPSATGAGGGEGA